MNALVVDRSLEFRADHPVPAAAPGESIVRVSLAGICGTDLEIARGYMAYRGVPGHEFVGRVAETANAALRGRRVVGEINAACGRCASCVAGLGRHCAARTVLGILGRDGAFAQYLRLPDENLIPVPDSVPDDAAVFVEPLAAAYEIFEQVHLSRNHRIAVLGDGRLGALVALALKGEQYQPIVVGHHAEKLSRLADLGLATAIDATIGDRFDVVVDCTGHGAGLARAIAMVKPRGTIILKSTAAQGVAINLAPVVVNEITVVGSRCGRFGPALDALAAKKIDPRPLLDGTFALKDGIAAFAAAENPANFKILLKPS
ncbi:MAG: alcohol dehydrogenase catalytic domain-containing protein [Candidatus Binatus sp.]|uniref:MDR/zinc-dependent alcohol dehydrogenase-like family protein n=1 Tax=Candidatus Binatus sp. TaxID=2811406 RepID=UPI00271D5FBC|nr:alcohol dehydrogenase catalytic domain-containing protein [Candidatus Binatus sp.]MDO8434143.1 alcohol dehydrogenase catalytic domain-containing protein [Candidatus Binatus sp.]